MFLDVLMRRNPRFIEAAMALHQAGKIPANAYVLDLDAVERNARLFSKAASALGLKAFAMTKQVGRHSGFCAAVLRGGINRAVAVDMDCATACHTAGLKTGHLGHLVQVPQRDADFAAATLKPDFWTVFSPEKAAEAARAAAKAGRVQNLLARIQTAGDTFYRGHEGGFEADEICAVADRLDALGGAGFAGITTFPALLFDLESRKVRPTPNLATLARAAEALARSGRSNIEINAPGTNSTVMLDALADAGANRAMRCMAQRRSMRFRTCPKTRRCYTCPRFRTGMAMRPIALAAGCILTRFSRNIRSRRLSAPRRPLAPMRWPMSKSPIIRR